MTNDAATQYFINSRTGVLHLTAACGSGRTVKASPVPAEWVAENAGHLKVCDRCGS